MVPFVNLREKCVMYLPTAKKKQETQIYLHTENDKAIKMGISYRNCTQQN